MATTTITGPYLTRQLPNGVTLGVYRDTSRRACYVVPVGRARSYFSSERDAEAYLHRVADTLSVPTPAPTRPRRRRGCDQCVQLRINGVVCHETGCPNAR